MSERARVASPSKGWRRIGRLGRRLAVIVSPVALAFGLLAAVDLASASELRITELRLEPSAAEGNPAANGLVLFATRARIRGSLKPEQGTAWRLEYATSRTGSWTVAATGVNTVNVLFRHLTPSTKYYIRLIAEAGSESATAKTEFTTYPVSAPEVLDFLNQHNPPLELREITRSSARVKTDVESNGAETEYHFEYAESEGGPWSPFSSGASGTVTVSEDFAQPEAQLTGLAPEKLYYIRVRASNEKGAVAGAVQSFTTHTDHPEAALQSPVQHITGTSAEALGRVSPQGSETQWRFEYATSSGGPWSAVPGASGTIAAGEATEEHKLFKADLTGLSPATTYYVRLFAENEHGTSISAVESFETAGPPLAETFAVHAVHGEAMRALGSVIPHGYDTHYHFQYVADAQFKASGWAGASSTQEVDVGPGELIEFAGKIVYPTSIVGADLAGLEAGERYDYRVVATNTSPGSPVAQGATETLTVPGASAAMGEGASSSECPNEAFRTGASGRLPDCRAYEMLTPVAKEGSQEVFNYGVQFSKRGVLVGEDGEHVMLQAPFVDWGSAPRDGQSPYFFSRTSSGWQMTAASRQPETGVHIPNPQVYSPDLTRFGFETFFSTLADAAPTTIEYEAGPAGGPYTTVATVPYAQVGQGGNGWVAASGDFDKLVLQVEDHALLGHPTGTTSGSDLYEYSAGQLRQVNVSSGGSAIGSCGARIVHGFEGGETGSVSSPHAVSEDGSRIFFKETPGSNCSEPSHLYVRVNGAETVDVGPYRFFAASADGSKLLVLKVDGSTTEAEVYDTQSATLKPLKGLVADSLDFGAGHSLVSSDLTTVYVASTRQLTPDAPAISPELYEAENLYRYDVGTETLSFVAQTTQSAEVRSSLDGRYLYFVSKQVGGVPGGVVRSPGDIRQLQVYRYDSGEGTIECVSCASSFDPEPKLAARMGSNQDSGRLFTQGGVPSITVSSANGDFAFFETPSALVPQDVDGEVEVEVQILPENEHLDIDQITSPSSDVYEWRRDGVDGCTHVQGCLSLITSGRGGFLNLLLGSTESGRDVFVYTSSQLSIQDNDTAGDVYDARMNGGFPPPPPRPVECEGDACSTPASAPNDATPSSLTFTGLGNVIPGASGVAVPKAKKPHVKCTKHKRSVGGRCAKAKAKHGRARHRTRGQKSSHRGGKR